MYNFIDVNEASERVILPSEALRINGEYIENQIRGYRTVHVSGREALAPELSTYTTGVRDGSVLKNKRFPERIITVTYQIIASTSEDYRKAFNKLAAILNVENAELVFNDEQDKYFIGTPSAISTPEPGRNAVIGEFEILCVDPFKYSVIEYTAEPLDAAGSFLVDYGGTYKSYPKLEAEFYKESEISADGESTNILTGNGDCGYVAFINDRKKIIQLGDPGETDTETLEDKKSQKLIINNFNTETSWGTGAKALWAVNKKNFESFGEMGSNNGTLGMKYVYPKTNNTPPSAQKQILSVKSKVGSLATYPIGFPGFTYNVYSQMVSRTANTATIQVTIDVSMWDDSSYFGYGLTASLYVNGTWYTKTLRSDGDPTWYGKNQHGISFIVQLKGLTTSAGKVSGVKFKTARPGNEGTAGLVSSTNCKDIEYSAYTTAQFYKNCYLGVSDYGTKASGAMTGFVGANIHREIPKDFLGGTGAKDFALDCPLYFDMGAKKTDGLQIEEQPIDTAQRGYFEMFLYNDEDEYISLRVTKSKAGKTAMAVFDSNVSNYSIPTIEYPNENVTNRSNPFSLFIQKIGKNLCFIFGEHRENFYLPNDHVIFTKLRFGFYRYPDSPPMSRLGIGHIEFIKYNCNNVRDIPNKFGSNDVLNVDCGSGEILLNGVQKPELGALGNDWEEFYLEPGINQMAYAYSTWVSDECAPKVRIRYREVFL